MDQIAKNYRAAMEAEQQKQFERIKEAAAAFRQLYNAHKMRATLDAPTDWSAIK